MEESELIPEPKGSSPQHGLPYLTPGVTVRTGPCSNTTRCTGACPDLLCQHQRHHTGQQQLHVGPYPHQELRCHPEALPFQHFEPCHREPLRERDGWTSQHRIHEDRGSLAATAASHNMRFDARDQFGCWDCQREVTERATGDTRRESEYRNQRQENEEELERPLPLRSDIDCQEYRPTAPCYTHLPLHNQGCATDLHCAQHGPYRESLYDVKPPYGHPPHLHPVFCQDVGPWMQYPQHWLHSGAESASRSDARGGFFSVNVPQFSLPPAERMLQVSVENLDDLGLGGAPQGEGALSNPNEKRKTISIPDDYRNIFITYSVDTCAQMVPFAEFLTKQGFRPAIDILDNPIRRMENKWMDSYLKDPSVLIIIAISPGYRADIERTGVDRHSLHTKYIYSMMQNEFIQQGSLNYRFVPVLFHHATQSHVPGWLQNTNTYRWPQDKENLLLRLLREERYIAPPVPKELTLIIRPVTLSSSATL